MLTLGSCFKHGASKCKVNVDANMINVAGAGPYLHVYAVQSQQCLLHIKVLDGCRVHGVSACSTAGGSMLLAVWGNRQLKVRCTHKRIV